MKKYNPLHCHSMYSLLDGLSKPSQIADRCVEIGATACALTDHGNIAGAIKFHKAMGKVGIKPILGCEMYICNGSVLDQHKDNRELSHFLILAKNLSGWQQLIALVSESNRPDYYYHKPRVDLDSLSKFCDGNLIGICGHLGSLLADKLCVGNKIISDWQNIGTELVYKLKDIFGVNNFFLESQLMDKINTPIQEDLTSVIRELGRITNTKVRTFHNGNN